MLVTEWPKSLEAWTRTKRSLAGGVSTGLRAQARPHPLFFSGGHGPRLTDLDGNSYLDYVLGWGPNILGHGHPALVEAVQQQVARGVTYGAGHEYEYLAAEAVLGAYPCFDRVVWSNSGSEAAQVALRVARGATGRQSFVKFEGHYHGWTDPVLVGYRHGRADSASGAESLGQSENAARDAVVLEWGDLSRLATVLAGLDVAAVVLEPILCNSGVIEPPAGFLEGVRRICSETGTVLIFDEVITGFRVDFGGAVAKYGVVPDLAILGKAIAGGLSLSAVVGKSELLDLTQRGVVHAGTYNGNPVVLSGALATLGVLAQPGTYERLDALGRRLATGLRDQLARHGILGAVNQVGPVVQCGLGVPAIRTFSEFMAADTVTYDLLLVELLRRGVFALPGGRWYLSTEHTEHDVDETVRIFGDALAALPHAAETGIR
jgi:glutamate-1-semialdehyde 2,1-aminomutase